MGVGCLAYLVPIAVPTVLYSVYLPAHLHPHSPLLHHLPACSSHLLPPSADSTHLEQTSTIITPACATVRELQIPLPSPHFLGSFVLETNSCSPQCDQTRRGSLAERAPNATCHAAGWTNIYPDPGRPSSSCSSSSTTTHSCKRPDVVSSFLREGLDPQSVRMQGGCMCFARSSTSCAKTASQP
jgi:hypothetical protein